MLITLQGKEKELLIFFLSLLSAQLVVSECKTSVHICTPMQRQFVG